MFRKLLAGLFLFSSAALALHPVHGQVILDHLDEYPRCQERGYTADACYSALERWLLKHPDDSFEAGKMARQKVQPWKAVPFFAKAFALSLGKCQDPDLQESLLSAWGLEASSNGQILEQARKITFDLCFAEMKDPLLVLVQEQGLVFKNACHGLKEKKALPASLRSKCKN